MLSLGEGFEKIFFVLDAYKKNYGIHPKKS